MKLFFDGRTEWKRSRGSENKTEVAVALQLDNIGRSQFLKMQVIPDAKVDTLLTFAKANTTEGTTIHSDAFKSYNTLLKKYCCNMQKYNPQSDDKRLKWLHVMIANIQKELIMVWKGHICNSILMNLAINLTGGIAWNQYLTIGWHVVYGLPIRRWLSFVYPIILGNDTIVVTPITVPATHCTILWAFIWNIFLVLPQTQPPNTAFSDQNKKKPCISGLPILGRPLFLPLIETIRKSTRFPRFYNVISNNYFFARVSFNADFKKNG